MNLMSLHVKVINKNVCKQLINFLACNCHDHSDDCVYDEEIDAKSLSLDIHGNYSGGGRCLNCQHNTEGINCDKCKKGFYRPANKSLYDLDVCQGCFVFK